MQIVDLRREEDFAASCQSLYERVRRELGEDWLVVGVETGGKRVVDAWAKYQAFSNCSIRAQRPTTAAKGNIQPLIRLLPSAVANVLRNVERVVYRAMRWMGQGSSRSVCMSAEAESDIARAGRILVVDDAIDSGETLKACLNAIYARNPAAVVKTAVLTVTEPHSALVPDVRLYDRVMLRFPWSSDSVAES